MERSTERLGGLDMHAVLCGVFKVTCFFFLTSESHFRAQFMTAFSIQIEWNNIVY